MRVFLPQRNYDSIPMLPRDTGKELCAKIDRNDCALTRQQLQGLPGGRGVEFSSGVSGWTPAKKIICSFLSRISISFQSRM